MPSFPLQLEQPAQRMTRSARHLWKISPRELGPDGLLGAPVLISHVIAAAATVVGAGERLGAVSIEDLQVVSAVRAGAELVVTTALEREEAGQLVVSVVLRHGALGAGGGIAVVGVLRFAVLTQEWRPTPAATLLHATARRGASYGLTPVAASFPVKAGPNALSGRDLVARVHETSLVSAQGFAGHPVTFEAVRSLSVLAPVHLGQALRLRCSVVHAADARVTVLSLLQDEVTRQDVLCALTSFRSSGRVPVLRPVSPEGRALSRDVARLHLRAAS
jgi:hypothetical protein